jgi:soluble lytic murein transglycosylase-like protein
MYLFEVKTAMRKCDVAQRERTVAGGIIALACALLMPALAFADPAFTQTADARAEVGLASPDDIGPSRPASDRSAYRMLVKAEAKQAGLPWEIADAVMAVESGYNRDAIGTSGEIGLMQILPSTARLLGFIGSEADLAVPETNIHYGVTYLAGAWALAGGDLCTAVMKYRAGHGETRFSYRSVDYCLAVRGKLLARGYPVTGSVPVATFGEADGLGLRHARGGACRRHCLGGGGDTVNLTALNSQLSALVSQVRFGR